MSLSDFEWVYLDNTFFAIATGGGTVEERIGYLERKAAQEDDADAKALAADYINALKEKR